METRSVDSVIVSLKKIAARCDLLYEILLDDKDHLTKSHLTPIEINNKKKAEMITELNLLVADINRHYPEGLLQAFKNIKPDLEEKKISVLNATMQDLNERVHTCYHHINLNNNIVYSNLSLLKGIWDKVIALKTKSISTYDASGRLK